MVVIGLEIPEPDFRLLFPMNSEEVRGEGIVGLVRGFMYAGAASVVASLWKVDDFATRELMVRFYRQMVQEHQNPSAALRKAQVSMFQDAEWSDPFYWAAFVVQGDWNYTFE